MTRCILEVANLQQYRVITQRQVEGNKGNKWKWTCLCFRLTSLPVSCSPFRLVGNVKFGIWRYQEKSLAHKFLIRCFWVEEINIIPIAFNHNSANDVSCMVNLCCVFAFHLRFCFPFFFFFSFVVLSYFRCVLHSMLWWVRICKVLAIIYQRLL